ncbi:MAG: glycoside hydrolase family 3 C-terminal domain-containing protein, partial [Segatella copri]
VMCAYQRWDDEPCCGNTRLLQQILRDEWGFKYLVVSDCGAVTDFWENHKVSSNARNAAAKGVLAGTDVECGYNYVYKSVPEAVKYGALTEEEVDKHVIRLLEGRFDLGEMDDNKIVSWSKIPVSVLCSKAHRQLSLDMALQTMTLLQNDNEVLPLNKKVKKIALIGPNVDNEPMMWGNYNGTPRQTITILDGIMSRLKKNQVVTFNGCDLVNDQTLDSYFDQCSMDGKKGFKGTFWNNRNMEGKPVAITQEKNPVQVTTYGQHSFAPNVKLVGFSAKYEAVFRPEQTDKVLLDVAGCGHYEVYLNGEKKAEHSIWRTTESRIEFQAEKGKEYKIEIRYHEMPNYNADIKFNIGHENPIDYQASLKKLKDCETVVFVGGISPQLEGEEMPIEIPGFKGGDRTDIELPKVQRNFLKALKEAGKKVVFVNCSGSAIALTPETESCDAILQVWYPGQEGGEAVARVLFGEYNPAGKLPITFYKNSEQLPDFKDYSMKGRTYRYMNDALFPFGYGLSYTSFRIGDATLSSSTLKKGEKITLKVPVSNVGKMDGTEVVQVYVKDPSDTDGPLKTLKAFERVEVKAGKTAEAVITLDSSNFELFDASTNTVRAKAGKYEVYYGNSSADKDLKKLDVSIEY